MRVSWTPKNPTTPDGPVLNERDIRAAAGILFLATFLSLLRILFRGNFIPIKLVIPFFLADFLVRVGLSPRFSPTLVLSPRSLRFVTGARGDAAFDADGWPERSPPADPYRSAGDDEPAGAGPPSPWCAASLSGAAEPRGRTRD